MDSAELISFICQQINAFLKWMKWKRLSLTIMSNSWEVKAFFGTVQSAGGRTKVLQSFGFPYTGDSVSVDPKLLYHLEAEGSQPCDSSGMLLWRGDFLPPHP
jgi:hypothetical protein